MGLYDQDRPFPPTRWTLIDLASDRSRPDANCALGELLERYLPALKTYLVAAKRLSPDQVEDIVHQFIADKILMGDLLAKADRARGRFRSFLLVSLDRYTISAFRKQNALRRTPKQGSLLSLDAEFNNLDNQTLSPSVTTCFDLAWTREIIWETLRRVELECETSGRPRFWEIFRDRVVNPMLQGTPPVPYATLATKLRFVSPIQAANALMTTKRMFERTFRDVVREYTGNDEDVEQEISELRAILSLSNTY